MDSSPPPPNGGAHAEQLEETAARWFAKRQSGAWTQADQTAFDAWLEENTAHRIQYIRIETAWKQSARMTALGAGVPPGVIPPRGSWGAASFFKGASPEPHPPPASNPAELKQLQSRIVETQDFGIDRQLARRRKHLHALAASLLLAITLGLTAYITLFDRGDRYSTPIGGMQNIALNDGSHVTLNTDTSLRASLNGDKERHIQLDKGEAFFEVAKDPTRPFVVYAGDKRVMAIGTKFSVRIIPAKTGARDKADVQVVVTEGLVKLATADKFNLDFPRPSLSKSTAATPANSHKRAGRPAQVTPGDLGGTAFLPAGAIARTADSEILVREDGSAEIEKLLSWRAGYVNFQDMPLADAVAEFNRYNTRKIFIEDPSIAAIHLSGNFRANNTEAFLDLIQTGFPINVENNGDKIILKSR